MKVTLSNQQFGFMPEGSTADAIFTLRPILEKYKEDQKNLYCAFIDLERPIIRFHKQSYGIS